MAGLLLFFVALPSPLKKVETHTLTQQPISSQTSVAALHQPIAKSKPNIAPKAKKPVEQSSVSKTRDSKDCASQLSRYDWPQSTAYRVMMKESSNYPGNLNDNPATGDYSVGCFQINLYGANARTRPSEKWLKNPVNNVSYAYGLWKSTRSFHGHWPNTCRIVGC